MSFVQQTSGKLSRLGLLVVFTFCVFSGLASEKASADDTLTIGSAAPKLDIEHWLSDRDGEFSGFTGFEKDKVYIVEFWATWCGPCISSMPHIVETQDKYFDKGVQIISVSREKLETVEKFLERKVRGEKETTYAELTSAYCLTTDPDGSVSKDYMKAAGQGGIPTAFIVGKTGEVEWIGHPMKMDKPLEEIVEDKWDRDAFAKEFLIKQKADLMMASIGALIGSGKPDEALKKIDAYLEENSETADARTLSRLKGMRISAAMEMGGDEAIAAFTEMIESAGENPRAINRLTSRIVSQHKSGKKFEEEILKAACEAAGRSVELTEKDGKDKATAMAMNTHANLLYICNKLEDAIAVQKKAVALADNDSFKEFLEELENESAAGADDLTIGSEAPALDVEHWVSDRDGNFSQVTKFEKGKVYIVEFWATWCGPCIASMPHLAELQGEYADQGVQIISISDEKLSKVEKFLEGKVRGSKDEEQTYADLTSAYCLTTDPDKSVYEDYMRAASQNGIPTAFIVGKSGLVEWIGHPMSMDKPLARIVDNKWDREKFAVSFKKGQEFSKLSKDLWDMKEDGDAKGALAELDIFMKDLDKDSQTYASCGMIRMTLVMEVGGPEAIAAFQEMANETDNPQAINQLAWGIVEKVQAGDEVEEGMLKVACEAAKRAVELSKKGKDKEGTAMVMDTHANLLFLCDKLDEAIEVQKAAIELSDDEQLADFLEKLMKAKKKKDV